MQSVVVPSVTKAFDVSVSSVVPKIYKLLVYETGSQYVFRLYFPCGTFLSNYHI